MILFLYTLYAKKCYGHRKVPSFVIVLILESKNFGEKFFLPSQNSTFTSCYNVERILHGCKSLEKLSDISLIEAPFHVCEYFPQSRNLLAHVNIFVE